MYTCTSRTHVRMIHVPHVNVYMYTHKKHDFPKTSPNRPQNEKKVPKKLGIILGTFWGLFSRII